MTRKVTRLRWNEPYKRVPPPWWIWVLVAFLGGVGSTAGAGLAWRFFAPHVEMSCYCRCPAVEEQSFTPYLPQTETHSGEL